MTANLVNPVMTRVELREFVEQVKILVSSIQLDCNFADKSAVHITSSLPLRGTIYPGTVNLYAGHPPG